MHHHLESVAAALARSAQSGGEKLKQLLIVSVLPIVLTCCGLPTGRDVRAYDGCVAPHPKEVVVCEGPRQAYELDPTAFQARAASISPPDAGSYQELSPAADAAFTPMPLHPSRLRQAQRETGHE